MNRIVAAISTITSKRDVLEERQQGRWDFLQGVGVDGEGTKGRGSKSMIVIGVVIKRVGQLKPITVPNLVSKEIVAQNKVR